MTLPEPTLHKPVPMGARVKIPKSLHGKEDEVWGEVVGISFVHVVFGYIVLLDHPLVTEYGPQRAITVIGSHLEGEDGVHWRHDPEVKS